MCENQPCWNGAQSRTSLWSTSRLWASSPDAWAIQSAKVYGFRAVSGGGSGWSVELVGYSSWKTAMLGFWSGAMPPAAENGLCFVKQLLECF